MRIEHLDQIQQVSTDTLLRIFEQCETIDSFVLYDPKTEIWYLGMAERAMGLSQETSCIAGFLAETFFNRTIETDSLWVGFDHGVMRYDHYYMLRADGKWPIAQTPRSSMKVTKEPYEVWEALFQKIQDGISEGTLQKVVASRCVQVELPETIHTARVLSNLMAQNMNSYVFCYRTGRRAFLGATPEILIEKEGDCVLSYALAGTVKKDVGLIPEEVGALRRAFLRDEKNTKEHGIVVDAIRSAMAEVTNQVEVGPMDTLELRNMLHLKTELVATDDTLAARGWVQQLHPTPAMGGSPRSASLALLAREENHERGFFASPIGVLLDNGDALVVVGIRSALIDGHTAYAFAGCGIVKESDCRSEYEEIDTKLRTMAEAL